MMTHVHYEQVEMLAFQEAKKGNSSCGDNYFMTETDEACFCLLADGLGSGADARQAANRAISVARQMPNADVSTLMASCNQALKVGRGAVLSMVKILFSTGELIFSGVGNVRFVYEAPDGKMHHLWANSGFMAGRPQTYRVQTRPFAMGSSFLIYSDGLALNSKSCKSLLDPPFLQANISEMENIWDDNRKTNDDATLIVGKMC